LVEIVTIVFDWIEVADNAWSSKQSAIKGIVGVFENDHLSHIAFSVLNKAIENVKWKKNKELEHMAELITVLSKNPALNVVKIFNFLLKECEPLDEGITIRKYTELGLQNKIGYLL
jgi:hypothetical protein